MFKRGGFFWPGLDEQFDPGLTGVVLLLICGFFVFTLGWGAISAAWEGCFNGAITACALLSVVMFLLVLRQCWMVR